MEIQGMLILNNMLLHISAGMNTLFNSLPQLNGIPMQGTIDLSIKVSSVIKCAAVCASRQLICDAIYYNESTARCTIVYNQLEDTTTRDISGQLFRIKESRICRVPGYSYIWELDNCLKFEDEKLMNWEDARINCQNETGDLAIIDSEFKDLLFLPYLQTKPDKAWWIGLSDNETEGVFKWVSGKNVTYDNWNISQPDGSGPDKPYFNADCGLYQKQAGLYAWFDRGCHAALAFVCENKICV